MKKVIALACALCALACSLAPCAAAADIKKGDIDGDKAVTVSDARYALRGAIGLTKLTDKQFTAADWDEDGEVTVSDARLILRVAIGLEDTTPKNDFGTVLYEHSHALLGTSKNYVTNDFTGIMKNFQKWCAYYTIGDVLRPVLTKLGYTQEAVDKLAPNAYPADIWAQLLRQHNIPLADMYGRLASTMTDIYSPSVIMAYYQQLEKEGLCKIYNFVDYLDNDISGEIVKADKIEIATYEPQVGDIVYITNKNMMEEASDGHKYNILVHTAQIVQVYENGNFLCTEGSIVEPKEGDGIARVREREYFWCDECGTAFDGYGNPLTEATVSGTKYIIEPKSFSTYIFRYNPTVVVLAVIRPDWSYGAPATK